jgi:exopolysaccharide production protein ExoY
MSRDMTSRTSTTVILARILLGYHGLENVSKKTNAAGASMHLGKTLVREKMRIEERNSASLRRSAAFGSPSNTLFFRSSASTPASLHGTPQVGLNAVEHGLKRIFDLISVAVILVLFGPVMLVIGALIASSTGSQVIYGHMRVGRHGKEFKCFKFRSMIMNSDQVLQDLLDSDPQARAEWERDFKLKNDPRITPLGRFIRRTSLDELPQLWNVLRGEMSVVGPRPVVREEFDLYYTGARRHYLSVPPGLTGLWQVSGRNDMSYEERVALDRRYVETWNVFTDFAIVMRTVGVMCGRKGAY